MSNYKLCKDCKHYRPHWFTGIHKSCTHPSSTTIDVVTGAKEHGAASTMRNGPCGMEGKYYEYYKHATTATERVVRAVRGRGWIAASAGYVWFLGRCVHAW